MDTLLLLLLFIFGGVALMVVLGEKFGKSPARGEEPEQLHKFTRWILPLVGLSIIIQMFRYWMQ